MKKFVSFLVVFAMLGSFSTGFAAEEKSDLLPPVEVQYDEFIRYLPPIEYGTIPITTGWNLISVPVLPTSPYKVIDFVRAVESPFRIIYQFDEALPAEFNEGEKIEKNADGQDVIIWPRPYWTVDAVVVCKDYGWKLLYPGKTLYPYDVNYKGALDYNMVPGEAYFVLASYHGPIPLYRDIEMAAYEEKLNAEVVEPFIWPPYRPRTSVTVLGRPVDISVTLNLNKGIKNGVSLLHKKHYYDDWPIYPVKPPIDIIRPCDINGDGQLDDQDIIRPIIEPGIIVSREGMSLSQLSRELAQQGVKATSIHFYKPETGWESYPLPFKGLIREEMIIPDDRYFFFDRIISSSEGFFLYCEENGVYQPGLDLSYRPRPPYPPFPPKPPKVKITRITDNTAVEWELTISGDKIVWTDNRDGDFDIYMYDISRGEEKKIIEVPIEDSNRLPRLAVHENKIVWADDRNGNSDIYMYDIYTGQEIQITDNSAGQYNPAIYGNKIVWDDSRNGNRDIYMYDLSTGEEHQITADPRDQTKPAIYKDKIVWEDNRDLYPLIFPHIYMYDLSTGEETKIANSPEMQIDPDIYEDKIVWTDFRHNNPQCTVYYDSNSEYIDYKEEIYMYDISTGEETRITTARGQQYGPAIQGGKIVWTDTRNGEGDIYMYDISTRKESRITVDPAGQHYPDIYGNMVVWIDGRDGTHEVYLGVPPMTYEE